jgi:dihydroxyacid dehydratase/phosphogluconate dehydratase
MLDLDVPTVSGMSLGDNLEWWENSRRRQALRQVLENEGIDPDDVIRTPERALPGTVTILHGNLAADGAIVKSTAIQPGLLSENGVYDNTGKARVFTSEREAITAIKERAVQPGEIIILIGVGPSFGMPETYQITSALKHIDDAGLIPLITDGRFSGVSTGPCIGHVTPEAAAGGPLGRLRDGDLIRILIDTRNLTGSIDVLVEPHVMSSRLAHPDLDDRFSKLPDDTRLWAALQALSGGSWGGCVYDTDSIIARITGNHESPLLT